MWVEKPAGRNLQETEQIAAAVAEAGVSSAVGFNYRNAPAVELARDLVASGRLGQVRHVRVSMLGDYCAHPDGALTWRFGRDLAGAASPGTLRRMGSTSPSTSSALSARCSPRPRRSSPNGQSRLAWPPTFSRRRGPLRPVENEDYLLTMLRFADGAKGSLEASRASVGEQNAYVLEVHGSTGALAWDFRRMGELRVCLDQDYQAATWSTRIMGPSDGEAGVFQPTRRSRSASTTSR